jgi:hypothetical protein
MTITFLTIGGCVGDGNGIVRGCEQLANTHTGKIKLSRSYLRICFLFLGLLLRIVFHRDLPPHAIISTGPIHCEGRIEFECPPHALTMIVGGIEITFVCIAWERPEQNPKQDRQCCEGGKGGSGSVENFLRDQVVETGQSVSAYTKNYDQQQEIKDQHDETSVILT